MTNSADPDQLASSEANWSGSTLFAKTGHVVFSKRRVKEFAPSGNKFLLSSLAPLKREANTFKSEWGPFVVYMGTNSRLFHHLWQGWQLKWLPVCFSVHQSPFGRWSTLKEEKEFAPMGSKVCSFRVDPFIEGSQNKILSPLKVYQFPLR